jgi:Na+/H+-dicarboxylate symporter
MHALVALTDNIVYKYGTCAFILRQVLHLTNIIGNAVATLVVALWEGALNCALLRLTLDD